MTVLGAAVVVVNVGGVSWMSCVSSILFYGLSRVEENARVVAVVVRFTVFMDYAML